MDNKHKRRKIILGLGSALGASQLGKWSQPVIDSVILPAHAETTTVAQHFFDNITLTFEPRGDAIRQESPFAQQETLFERGLSLLVNDAHAGVLVPIEIPAQLCIDTPDGTAFTAKLGYGTSYPFFHEASGTIGGGPVPLPPTAGCRAPTGTLEVTAITNMGAQVKITIGNGSGNPTVPEAPGCPEKPIDAECPNIPA